MTAPPRPASQRALSLPRSAIREIMVLASATPDVIHLELGEPDFGTPPHIVESAIQSLRDGWTRYTPNPGTMRLRELIAARFAARLGRPVEVDRVVATTGAVGALFTAVNLVAEAGDEVLIPDPGWPNYHAIVHLAGAVPVRFRQRPQDGYLPDLDEVASLIGPRTKAILYNTPGNPTGAVFPREIVAGLAALADKHGLYLIADEVYEDIVFDGGHVSAAAFGLDDRVFLVSGASKSYAMTGFRVGYLLCPPALGPVAAILQEPVTSHTAAISQKAVEAALSGPQDSVAQARETFRRRRDVVLDVLGNTGLLPAPPSGAFYALVAIGDRHPDSMTFAKALLTERKVATVPGITFGPSCDKTVRIAFTTDDAALRTGLERFRDYVEGR